MLLYWQSTGLARNLRKVKKINKILLKNYFLSKRQKMKEQKDNCPKIICRICEKKIPASVYVQYHYKIC